MCSRLMVVPGVIAVILALLSPRQPSPQVRVTRPVLHTSNEVLVVSNVDSPVSTAIAQAYIAKRHVRNMLAIHCADSAVSTANETLDLATYQRVIESPVKTYLAAQHGINFIVLTKGVPIRVSGAPIGSCEEHTSEPAKHGNPSVDSLLAALGYESLPGSRLISITGSGATGAGYLNRFWNAPGPFSHAKYGGYLVTRLDGYTQADAMALIDRSVLAGARKTATSPKGEVLLDVQPAFGMGDKSTQPVPITASKIDRESDYSDFNADMLRANDLLKQRGIEVEMAKDGTFIGQRNNLLAYFSWGSNDAKYSEAAYESLRFAPGSICDTAVSTSGRTMLHTSGGQSLINDLIAHGLTCGKGYVDEPLLQAIASPSITLDRYTSGYTAAESLYAGSHFVGWEDIVIGDPLCAPYFK